MLTIARLAPKDVTFVKKPITGARMAPPTTVVHKIPATVPSSLLSNELIVKENMLGNIIEVKNPTEIKLIADKEAIGAVTASNREIKQPKAYRISAFEVFK